MKNTKKLLALLLALVMLLALCACGSKSSDRSDDDDETASDPETIAETFAQRMTESDYKAIFDLCAFDLEDSLKDECLAGYDDKDELFEDLSDKYGKDIDSWKDFYAVMMTKQQDFLADEYGEDYKIKTKVLDTADLDEDELDDVKDYLLDEWGGYINEDEVENIPKGMDVTIKVTIKGDEDESSATYTITMVQYDGEWKVADYDEEDEDTAITTPTTNQARPSATQPKPTTTRPITTTAPTTTQPQPSATQPVTTPLGSWVCEGVTITFSFDGTGSLSEGSEYMAFTWKYQNGNLILVDEYGDETAVRYSVNGNTLTLINGDGETLDFTKKTASDSVTQTTASPAGTWESDGVTMTLYTDGSGYIMVDDMSITLEWASTDNRIAFLMSGEEYYGEYIISGKTMIIYYDNGTIEVWTKK